jgi:hypothetical protein
MYNSVKRFFWKLEEVNEFLKQKYWDSRYPIINLVFLCSLISFIYIFKEKFSKYALIYNGIKILIKLDLLPIILVTLFLPTVFFTYIYSKTWDSTLLLKVFWVDFSLNYLFSIFFFLILIKIEQLNTFLEIIFLNGLVLLFLIVAEVCQHINFQNHWKIGIQYLIFFLSLVLPIILFIGNLRILLDDQTLIFHFLKRIHLLNFSLAIIIIFQLFFVNHVAELVDFFKIKNRILFSKFLMSITKFLIILSLLSY